VDKPPFLDSWAPSPAPLNYNVFRALVVAFSGNTNITLEVYARLLARGGHAESARDALDANYAATSAEATARGPSTRA
jgi:hypothetical protein